MPYRDRAKQREAQRAYEARKRNSRRAAHNKIKEAAKAFPCADCGIMYAAHIMQFDHLRDKEFTIAKSVNLGVSRETLLLEIEKCDVVCANCHAHRTHTRRRG